ncbi:GNAT family N-acetyltransferase [Agromyces sp. ISL-38]|uniref:GNAT family N-acetyltransferase n=1 Tax=Agromyces sp. ISL-38 TaxID=2819107 RepID=UPI001BE4EB66|nr:GNAT family N-acetyltransferase [Agromyces sp. ISL-38]MBT2497515.1 GNAT family N-acetyltransferase [Agromyces sp. ISL-38]
MVTNDLSLVPKSIEETATWLPIAMSAYEQARIAAGDSAEGAAAARQASEQQFFPDGSLIDGQLLFTVVADGEDAGWLWIGPSSDASNWWVWDIRVHDAFRRRGIGRAAMQLAEDVARSQGATSIRLNVFADNEGAIRLYDELGYETTAISKQKRL